MRDGTSRSLLSFCLTFQPRESHSDAWVWFGAGGIALALASIWMTEPQPHLGLGAMHSAGLALVAGATAMGKLRRASAPLRQAETTLFQDILHSAGPMILAIGLDGRIREVNRSVERVLGYELRELKRLPSIDPILGPGEGLRLLRALQAETGAEKAQEAISAKRLPDVLEPVAPLPGGRSRRFQGDFCRKDGTTLPVVLEVSALRDDLGYMHGMVVVAMERPEAASDATTPAPSEHDRALPSPTDRAEDDFIATVSHEFRTPLTSIRGALGLLTAGALEGVSEKADKLLRIALSNAERLALLVNDILDLDRMHKGREPLVVRSVDLSGLVSQAVEGMLPLAQAANVHLSHNTAPVQVMGDSDRLLQVLTNLLSNAVKFSPPHSTVSVRMRTTNNGVILSVVDQGRGIPVDKLESIFERFQQVDASDSRQKGGTGLGLTICRTIVSRHGGRIWAERNPRRGATFRVFLPYTPGCTEQMVPDVA